jgi:hypothetical protein
LILSRYKKRLARLRDALLHGRHDRRLAARATSLRADWIDDAARRLPPLREAPDHPSLEVHSFSGEGQAVMGLFSSWSLMRFLPHARFVLHSDGSLTPETIATWTAMLPGMRVIEPAAGAAAMVEQLADMPHVQRWCREYHFGPKLGSVHCLAEAPRIVEMDTDVLVLSDPGALHAACAAQAPGMTWNLGHQYAYGYPEALLAEVLGDLIGPLPDRLNGGFLLASRNSPADWTLLEDILARLWADPRTDPLRYWMQQTLVACLASRMPAGAAVPLPAGYDIYMGPTRPGTVVRHFVGTPGVRPRFYTEGVPSLIADACARGQLPADFAPAAGHGRPSSIS